MKNKEKKKYIFILSFLAVTVIFISWTLFKFYSVTHKRIYDMKIEEMKNLSMQGSAVVEKRLEGVVNLLYGLAEYIEEEDITDSANMEKIAASSGEKRCRFSENGNCRCKRKCTNYKWKNFKN